MTTTPDKIKNRMHALGITTQQLAKTSGVPEGTVKNLIYGYIRKPGKSTMVKIAGALSCPVDDIMGTVPPSIRAQKAHQSGRAWNATLYVEASKAVATVVGKENISLTEDQAISCTQKIYTYALESDNRSVDLKIAHYIITTIGD